MYDMNHRWRGHRADVPLKYFEIERLARKARQHLVPGLPVDEPFPGIKLFERLDEHFVLVDGHKVPLTYEAGELPGSVAGEAWYYRKSHTFVVKLSDETYGSLQRDEGPARFSFAHELGHIFLHSKQLQKMARIPHTEAALLRMIEPPHPVYYDTEWQADSLAAALLMPALAMEKLIRTKNNSLVVSLIRRQFNVSHKAAKFRYDNFLKRRKELLRA